MTKEVEMPVASVPYESSLREVEDKKWCGSAHHVKVGGALYLVPGVVKQAHANVAGLTGRRAGTYDWLAACMYATKKGASEVMIIALTGGPRNNVWREAEAGLRPKLEGFRRKDVDPITGKALVFRCIRKAK